MITEQDLYLFNEGTHYRLFDKLGSRVVEGGVEFAVWAPNAKRVSVIGDFNAWKSGKNNLRPAGSSGIWHGTVKGLKKGDLYKYRIESHVGGHKVEKADPFGFRHETPPKTASVVWDLDYKWNDSAWMKTRKAKSALDAPMSTYELHLGSWRGEGTYREIAPKLAEYVKARGFTHVELMPVMEHPFGGSWGYQITGYFAPTSRFGSAQDFMFLIDHLHQNGIGVILDWVPSHFPNDEHGLAFFDGTHLYEHADPRKGFHPDWKSAIFNYGRNEVRAFLISNALFWLEKYHIDALRVDAVASMLYLDYSRKEGEWIPNQFGGRENLEAIDFLRKFNEAVYGAFPDVQTIAEESTAWGGVSRPTYLGGLGFGMKWDMGWMHDTLTYMRHAPIHRRYHHDKITFRMIYAFHENFVMPLSHDEVVHGKGSLIGQMGGSDDWQKFANLRLLLAYLYGQPGKKLLFMGGEIAQWREWSHDSSIDWGLLSHPNHLGVQKCLERLNAIYRDVPALHQLDADPLGFEWIDCNDADNSVLTFLRKDKNGGLILAAYNFTPVPREGYRIGLPRGGRWEEILNTDAKEYWGSGMGNMGSREAEKTASHGREWSISATLPPLSAVFFRSGG